MQMRYAAAAACLILFSPFILAEAESDDPPWPPEGPAWETDPDLAFARAREEGKAIMAFIATGG